MVTGGNGKMSRTKSFINVLPSTSSISAIILLRASIRQLHAIIPEMSTRTRYLSHTNAQERNHVSEVWILYVIQVIKVHCVKSAVLDTTDNYKHAKCVQQKNG